MYRSGSLCLVLGTGLLIASLLGSCSPVSTPVGSATPSTPTATLPADSSPTPAPTLTPTPQPFGSAQNPILMGIVSTGEDPEVAQNIASLVEKLSQKTGLTIQSVSSESYEVLVKALAQGKTHMAWLPPADLYLRKPTGCRRGWPDHQSLWRLELRHPIRRQCRQPFHRLL